MSATIKLTLNGSEVEGREGQTILEIARAHDIYIPTLCHDEHLKPIGACRTCIGEIKGVRNLQSTCTYPAADGMVVETENERVKKTRRVVCELLLADHPEAIVNKMQDQPRANELIRVAEHSDALSGRFRIGELSTQRTDAGHPFITFDDSTCINCYRCIRGCDEVQGENVLTMAGRGYSSFIANDYNETFLNSTCVSCGQCVQQCPTGALEDAYLLAAKKWDREVKSTCAYCGTGCSLIARVKDDEIVGITGNENSDLSLGHLCVKGRYAYSYIDHKDRVTTPLIRNVKTGEFEPASWDEAVTLVADKIQQVIRDHGPSACGGISSSRATNEENFLFQKFWRNVVGTNNIDNCSRVCHSPTAYGLRQAFGESAGTGSLRDIDVASVLMIIGSNPTEAHPIIGARIRQASRRGATMIVIDPRRTQAAREADLHLPVRPGGNVAILNALAHVIIEEGLVDEEFVSKRAEGYEQLKSVLAKYAPEDVKALTGVDPELIRKAARAFGSAHGKGVICYGLGVTEHSYGSQGVMCIANLATLTGNIGRHGGAVIPMRGQNNVQGSSDMGALPATLAGYVKVTDPAARELHKQVWGKELPTDKGYILPLLFDAMIEKKVKLVWIIGEDVLQSDPDTNHVEAALDAAEMIVGQDLFINETNKKAHVIFPAASFLEKDGTFTNFERRVQRIRKVIEPMGECKADWEIIQLVANALGADWNYTHPSQIMDEVGKVDKKMAGIDYDRLDEFEGMQWPVWDKDHPGSPTLHAEATMHEDGMIRLHPFEYHPPGDEINDEYPFELTTGRKLEQYNVGAQTRRTDILSYDHDDRLEIHPEDARRLEIKDQEWVEISSRRDAIRLRVQVTTRIREGTVFTTFHFPETALNRITSAHVDGPTGCPEYKFTAVGLVRVGGKDELAEKHLYGEVPMPSGEASQKSAPA